MDYHSAASADFAGRGTDNDPRHTYTRPDREENGMRILCNIDQAESLRRGVNAPSSTAEIEVDPATLSQEHRTLLADRLSSGHIFSSVSLYEPTVAGLSEALSRVQQAEDERAQRVAAQRAQRDAEILEEIGAEKRYEIVVGLDREGKQPYSESNSVVRATLTVPREPNVYSACDASPEIYARYEAARTAAHGARAAAIEAALPALRVQLAEFLARGAIPAGERRAPRIRPRAGIFPPPRARMPASPRPENRTSTAARPIR